MKKSIVIVFVTSGLTLAGSLFLEACGGKSGNESVPKVAAITDDSEAVFSGPGSLTVSSLDEVVEQVNQKDPTCAAQESAGHRIVDSRVLPKAQFVKTIQTGTGSGIDKYTVTSTILSNDSTSYSRQDDYQVHGETHSDTVNCDFKNISGTVTGPDLNCLDQNPDGKTKILHNSNHCRITSPNGDKDIKITYQQSIWPVSGKNVPAIRIIKEHDGLLTCNNKPIGQGKDISEKVYTYDIPSLTQDTCEPAEVYSFQEKIDNAKNIYSNSSEALTSYLVPEAPSSTTPPSVEQTQDQTQNPEQAPSESEFNKWLKRMSGSPE